jgi:glycosyltransferase involved in cell wall biosynthesis
VNNPAVLAALFQQAKLLFVTSEWESFCVPIAESLYFGVPVAVTDTPPMPEVAGPAGVVFDKQKVAAAVAQILTLLDNPDQYQTLAAAASERAQLYTDDVLAQNIQKLLAHIATT